VATALCLLKPIEFIADGFNRSTVATNKLGQTVNLTTELFLTIDDLIYESTIDIPVSGLVIYIVNYLKSTASAVSVLKDKLSNIDFSSIYGAYQNVKNDNDTYLFLIISAICEI
jgi:hypothetical protein